MLAFKNPSSRRSPPSPRRSPSSPRRLPSSSKRTQPSPRTTPPSPIGREGDGHGRGSYKHSQWGDGHGQGGDGRGRGGDGHGQLSEARYILHLNGGRVVWRNTLQYRWLYKYINIYIYLFGAIWTFKLSPSRTGLKCVFKEYVILWMTFTF